MCDIEILIGKRLRQRRVRLDLTQAEIGKRVGVRPQQVARYEAGENRISAVTLWRIADVLDQPIEAFFQGLSRSQPACVRPSGGTGPQSQHSDGEGA